MAAASFTAPTALRVVGAAAVVVGGLLAAVTAPLHLEKGSWAAAYLVLVMGVAQIAMGSARQRWRRQGPQRQGWMQFALWNLGSIGVIAGTATAATAFVYFGSALLVAALVLAFLATLGTGAAPGRHVLTLYRVLLVLLAVSVPVGMVLSYLRHL